jgi:hypothetical protein
MQDSNQASVQSILTPLDELDFWAELASRPGAASKVAQQVKKDCHALHGLRKMPYSLPCRRWKALHNTHQNMIMRNVSCLPFHECENPFNWQDEQIPV